MYLFMRRHQSSGSVEQRCQLHLPGYSATKRRICQKSQDNEEEDALDAFMAAEVLPEVTAAQQAERAAREQERLERAKALAVSCLASPT